MERRGEPRFPVKSTIRVIVPGDDARTIESDLVDVSATGMRIVTSQQLDPENVVAIEVDSRLILAEVRYCRPRGDRFEVGAKRLHEIGKDAQLSDAPAVVAEMLGHLRRHIGAGDGHDSGSMALQAMEAIVERSETQQVFDVPVKSPEPEPSEPVAQHVLVEQHEIEPEVPEEHAEPIAEHVLGEQHEIEPEVRDEDVVEHKIEPEPEPVAQCATEVVEEHATPMEEEIVEAAAIEAAPVHAKRQMPAPAAYDPLEAARQSAYAQSASAVDDGEKGSGNINWRIVLSIAAGLILAVMIGVMFIQRRSEAKPAPVTTAAQAPAPAAPKPVVHHAQVRMLRANRFSLTVDDGEPFKASLAQDAVHQFDFSRGAVLHVDDGNAVEVMIDGNLMGPIQGGPQVLDLTPKGVELVK
jgi:PilZ domain